MRRVAWARKFIECIEKGVIFGTDLVRLVELSFGHYQCPTSVWAHTSLKCLLGKNEKVIVYYQGYVGGLFACFRLHRAMGRELRC